MGQNFCKLMLLAAVLPVAFSRKISLRVSDPNKTIEMLDATLRVTDGEEMMRRQMQTDDRCNEDCPKAPQLLNDAVEHVATTWSLTYALTQVVDRLWISFDFLSCEVLNTKLKEEGTHTLLINSEDVASGELGNCLYTEEPHDVETLEVGMYYSMGSKVSDTSTFEIILSDVAQLLSCSIGPQFVLECTLDEGSVAVEVTVAGDLTGTCEIGKVRSGAFTISMAFKMVNETFSEGNIDADCVFDVQPDDSIVHVLVTYDVNESDKLGSLEARDLLLPFASSDNYNDKQEPPEEVDHNQHVQPSAPYPYDSNGLPTTTEVGLSVGPIDIGMEFKFMPYGLIITIVALGCSVLCCIAGAMSK